MKRVIVGTTSFIFPAPVRENCKKLEGIVDEVSIVLFETISSLKYTEKDLPSCLKKLNLSYNVHLPLDLPWDRGVELVVEIIIKLMEKTSFLSPKSFILHPPPKKELFVECITKLQKNNILLEKILIENIEGEDLSSIWDIILTTPLNVCLDIGHLIEYNQHDILSLTNIFKKIKMLHLYTPEKGRHTSLDLLKKAEKQLVKNILQELLSGPDSITVILEVFNHKDLLASLDFFKSLCRELEVL